MDRRPSGALPTCATAGRATNSPSKFPRAPFVAADATVLADLFARQYRKNFNRTIPNLGVEVMTWTLVLSRKAPAAADDMTLPLRSEGSIASAESVRQVFDPESGTFMMASVLQRNALPVGSRFCGPALIVEDQTTTYVPATFDGSVSVHGHLVLDRRS